MTKFKTITFRMGFETLRCLQDIAQKFGWNQSEAIRNCLSIGMCFLCDKYCEGKRRFNSENLYFTVIPVGEDFELELRIRRRFDKDGSRS